mmetsp:Transcript_45111/g.107259  ORF Transcript_45111/g.107259 Transcript_45111/m.107259 type:complete len:244 (+) Transcript_45111:1390-2121(+)
MLRLLQARNRLLLLLFALWMLLRKQLPLNVEGARNVLLLLHLTDGNPLASTIRDLGRILLALLQGFNNGSHTKTSHGNASSLLLCLQLLREYRSLCFDLLSCLLDLLSCRAIMHRNRLLQSRNHRLELGRQSQCRPHSGSEPCLELRRPLCNLLIISNSKVAKLQLRQHCAYVFLQCLLFTACFCQQRGFHLMSPISHNAACPGDSHRNLEHHSQFRTSAATAQVLRRGVQKLSSCLVIDGTA